MRILSISLVAALFSILFLAMGISQESATKKPAKAEKAEKDDTPKTSEIKELATPENAGEVPMAELVPRDHYSDITKRIAHNMPLTHLKHYDFDDKISRTALKNYLKTLDFDRSLFLEEDIEAFEDFQQELDDQLKDGDMEFAYEVFKIYRERVEDRVAFVNKLLEEGFDFDVEETYAYKRERAPYTTSIDEWDDLWRKKIKNEYLVTQVYRELDEEEAAEKEKDEPAKEDDPDTEADESKKDEDDEELDSIEETIKKKYDAYLRSVKQQDSEHVLQTYMNAFTRAYDSHSAFLAPRAEEDFNIDIGLKLTGIGAQLSVKDGAALITKIIKGGPAEKDGRLQKDDKIVAVGQGKDADLVDIVHWPLFKSVRLIRGPIDSTVVLKVIPADNPGKTVLIDLERDEIKLEDRAAKSSIIEHEHNGKNLDLGYIYLPDFYEDMQVRNGRNSANDVKKLLEKLDDDGIDGLLFDMRDNGGGSLRAAVKMAGLFIEDGPIVQVQDQFGVRQLKDPDGDIVFKKPMVVLVNRHSASASEILAAAMQDYGRAIVIGDTQTHGKGTVQSLIPLQRNKPKFGSFKVTTAEFFRIDGKSTQLKGVTPDLIFSSPLDNLEIGEEFLDKVLKWSTVKPAAFQSFGRMNTLVPKLVKKMEARQTEDDDTRAYKEMVAKHKKRQDREEVSLNMERRKAQARSDRDLADVQKKYKRIPLEDEDDVDEDEDEIEGAKDIILEESKDVIGDLIRLMREQDLIREGGV